jgi:hypothetical protein
MDNDRTSHTRTIAYLYTALVELSDPEGDQSVVFRGKGKQEMGSFWAHHVSGPCMDIALQCAIEKGEIKFEIDDYVAGYPVNIAADDSGERSLLRAEASLSELERHRDLSLCGADDKKNAVCYNTVQFSEEYGKARAVARLYINGSGACTGWVSP